MPEISSIPLLFRSCVGQCGGCDVVCGNASCFSGTRDRTIRTSPTLWIAENSQYARGGAGENPLERRYEKSYDCVAVYPASRNQPEPWGLDEASDSSVRLAWVLHAWVRYAWVRYAWVRYAKVRRTSVERRRAATVRGGVVRLP